MQQSIFFESGGHRLYGVHFPTAQPEAKLGFVLCNGFAGEHVVCRSHLSHYARKLQAQGHPVLRFDYRGYGDSDGDFTDATVPAMCADIQAATEELKQRSGCEGVALLGIRMGATLACLVAAERTDIRTLILWEPLPDLWTYIYAELRQTVAMQTILFRDVRMTRDEILANIAADTRSLVDGYDLNCIDDGFALGAEFISSIKNVDLEPVLAKIGAATLVVHLREKDGEAPKKLRQLAQTLGAGETTVELTVAVEKTLPWKHGRFYMTHSPALYQITDTWLKTQ